MFAFYEHTACWEKQAFINSLYSRLTHKCVGRYIPQMWYPKSRFHWEGPQSTLEVHEIRTGFLKQVFYIDSERERTRKRGKEAGIGGAWIRQRWRW